MTKSPPSEPEVRQRETVPPSGSVAEYRASTSDGSWFSATLPGALPTRLISGPSLTSVTATVNESLSAWPSSSVAMTVTS